jgi:hypothetical protein
MSELTQEYLKQLFEYKNGELYWKQNRAAQKINGKVAGSKGSNGYKNVGIDGQSYLLHRLIYCYHFGFFPKMIDHIDGNTLNNCIENLRKTNYFGNCSNAKTRKDNESGTKGVFCQGGKWRAMIRANKKTYSKMFNDKNDAIEFVKQKRIELHKEFANHG